MEEARAIRASISGLADGADDEKLIDNKAAFPHWNGNGIQYKVGDILQDDDKLYRVVQAHRSQSDWKPSLVPALFTEISLDEYPEWRQPTGAQDAYKIGNKVHYPTADDPVYISTVDNNVWEPGVYGWDLA